MFFVNYYILYIIKLEKADYKYNLYAV